MRISIITLFPQMISSFFEESIIKRAIDKKLIEIEIVNLREFAQDKYGTVDERPYGGGAGMVLKADILFKALEKVKPSKTVLTSAKGKVFNQQKAKEYSQENHLVIIAGHYEGVDERILEFVDEEISMGDFVMTGGEIAAVAIVDAVVRLLPGVLKKETATQEESFFEIAIDRLIAIVGESDILKKLKEEGKQMVQLIEYPHYTRPEEWQGKRVPQVLLNGNHAEIEKWRITKAYEETLKKRPDLLSGV